MVRESRLWMINVWINLVRVFLILYDISWASVHFTNKLKIQLDVRETLFFLTDAPKLRAFLVHSAKVNIII